MDCLIFKNLLTKELYNRAQMHQPLAIAVIGGFLVALPLLLIIFPVLLNLAYGREK